METELKEMSFDWLSPAIESLDVEAVETLLKKGTSPNQAPRSLLSSVPLISVIGHSSFVFPRLDQLSKREKIIDLLLACKDIKIDCPERSGKTALYEAVFVKDIKTIKKLIKKGANPNIKKYDLFRNSPLTLAIRGWKHYLEQNDATAAKEYVDIIRILISSPKIERGNLRWPKTMAQCVSDGENEVVVMLQAKLEKIKKQLSDTTGPHAFT